MSSFRIGPLLKQIAPYRNEVVETDGISMPKSAAMLLFGLANETDSDVRFDLLRSAISECGLADDTAAAVKLAQTLYQELNDDLSLMILSRALFENNELEAGLLRAREAFELAIETQGGINNTGGNLVRLSVKTGAVERVNEAMEALIDSTDVPRKGDCVLDTDWCDDAEALGANLELISWIRMVGAEQLKRSKLRQSQRRNQSTQVKYVEQPNAETPKKK